MGSRVESSGVIFCKNMQVLNQEVKKAESEDTAITKTKKDFSEDEKKIIVEECAQKLCGPKFLSKKHNTSKNVINIFVREAGLPHIPDDLSSYPNFPRNSEDVSQDEFMIVIKKYWENEKKTKKLEKQKKRDIMLEKPEKTDNMSQEEYQKVLKNYFNQNNLKHRDDFSVEEKKEIVRECTVNLIGPKKLSEKYKTIPSVIARIVKKAGFPITPDFLSKYPDLPKKSEDMSDEEFQKVMKKYWNEQKKKKHKEKREKVKQREEKKKQLKETTSKAMENESALQSDQGDNQQNPINESKKKNSKYPTFSPQNPVFIELLKDYPDYPQSNEGMSKKDYQTAVKKYFKLKGLKHKENFTEPEKKEIVKECIVNLIGPKRLSQKHKTMAYVIRHIVEEKHFKVTPDNLSEYPDYPKKTEDISEEEYKEAL